MIRLMYFFFNFYCRNWNSSLSMQHNLTISARPSCFPCFLRSSGTGISWGPVTPDYYGWRLIFLFPRVLKPWRNRSHCSQVRMLEVCTGQLPRGRKPCPFSPRDSADVFSVYTPVSPLPKNPLILGHCED